MEVLALIRKEFGKRVKEFRKAAGLTQEKFALKVGLDRTYISSLEAGKRNVALTNLEKIANGLELSIAELFEGIGNHNDND